MKRQDIHKRQRTLQRTAQKAPVFLGGDEWAFLSGWVGGGEASLFLSTVFSTGLRKIINFYCLTLAKKLM
jgi:hypothetical protein